MPEALEGEISPDDLFPTLLVGVVFFFLLDKAEMWHYVHARHAETPEPRAYRHVWLAGAVTALGGVVGYALVDQLYAYLPFFLILAASSFL